MGTKVSDIQKNVIPHRRKGCPGYAHEFKQQFVAVSCQPDFYIKIGFYHVPDVTA
ncbi:IS66 family insertion sequence hypothetical protein [Salmonella bongori]|nr:IS66 family insertion sequence hypothetical protein [Salmonella bongori]ECE6549163.1 IS66 family insertion sequence hypothetical protein [Salmonella bongori]ECI3520465.1 IS66 family insertion sequence hypothetical protein [Salmonella bongori]